MLLKGRAIEAFTELIARFVGVQHASVPHLTHDPDALK
jgi:hypothetical protein